MKQFYIEETKRISEAVNSADGDLKFAAVTDTHLDNSVGDTLANISSVDASVGFDFLIHLGDYLNGNIPHDYTEKIFREQIESFDACVSGDFYPVQGNHDGYMDFIHNDMATDELWKSVTGLEKPYYFVDFPDKKIRIIILCTCYYRFDNGRFFKGYGISDSQLSWFRTEALDIQPGWTVMIFSHQIPFQDFSDNALSDLSKTNAANALKALISAKEERGFDVAAWIAGDTHGEFIGKVCDINAVIIGNETAYVPQLWKMPEGGYFEERTLGTVTEDLWDAIVLDKSARELKFFRFGAGCDRVLKY